MKELICSFFGHRDTVVTDELYKSTYDEILRAFDLGCRIFYFGGYGNFDDLCYKIVSEIKVNNPDLNIQRIFCVPQERYLRKKASFFNHDDFDEIIYLLPSFEGW